MLTAYAEGCARARLLAEAISSLTDVDPEEILGRRRLKAIAAARHQLYVDLWHEGYSIADIGRILDRDHTTVMHGMRKVLGTAYDGEIDERYPLSGYRREHFVEPVQLPSSDTRATAA